MGPAFAIFAAAVATFLAIGMALGAGTTGLVVAQLVGLAGTTLVATRWLTGGWDALGLYRPRAIALAGAALIGTSFWYINLTISLPVAEWLGGTDELTAFQVRWLGDRSLGELLVTLAVLPAVCEEVVCRGLLARALAARHPAWLAAVVSAAAFSLLHLSLARALPTFTLGVVLAWLVIASGSLWPAVVAHAINNALAIALARGALEPLGTVISDHGGIALASAAVLSGFGGFLVSVGQRNHPDTST